MLSDKKNLAIGFAVGVVVLLFPFLWEFGVVGIFNGMLSFLSSLWQPLVALIGLGACSFFGYRFFRRKKKEEEPVVKTLE